LFGAVGVMFEAEGVGDLVHEFAGRFLLHAVDLLVCGMYNLFI
jgi:hypothetical protein